MDFDGKKDVIDFRGAKLIDVKTYGNVNAAENVLGVELDGLAKSTGKGKVTVAYGDSDGDGKADFAVALIGVNGLDGNDVIHSQANPAPFPIPDGSIF